MRKCTCRGFNAECHFCAGTGIVAESIDDNAAGKTLRASPSFGPKVVATKRRKNTRTQKRFVVQKVLKGANAYLFAVAESTAAGSKAPPPPETLRDEILASGGVGRWIASRHKRKTFYLSLLYAAKTRLK